MELIIQDILHESETGENRVSGKQSSNRRTAVILEASYSGFACRGPFPELCRPDPLGGVFLSGLLAGDDGRRGQRAFLPATSGHRRESWALPVELRPARWRQLSQGFRVGMRGRCGRSMRGGRAAGRGRAITP